MKRTDVANLIEQWETDQVINSQQASYMLADLEQTAAEQSGNKFVVAIAVFGASVLVAGVLLLIASNWNSLGKLPQLGLALLLPILPLTLAYYLSEVKRSRSILVAVANIAGIGLIGGAISLIGQIYNLESGYVTLLWLWTILSLPFVFVLRRAENVVGSAVLLGGALLFTLLEQFGWWRDEQALVLTLTVGALLYAGTLYSIGAALRHSAVWGKSVRWLRLLSAPVATVTLFVTTFEFYAKTVLDISYRDPSSAWILLSVFLNFFFIGFLVFVLLRAFRYQEERLAFGVIRLLFLYLIVKYFTLFSDMFETGLLLIGGGILFISGAWYFERHKNQLRDVMRQQYPARSKDIVDFQPSSYE